MELRCQSQSSSAAASSSSSSSSKKAPANTKSKFAENEKVLCYEPDPVKTKVLYDAKVLKLVHKPDDQGRKILKFLIHFYGWNSSWDRCVTEEYLLKDTEENRELQKKLNKEAGGQVCRTNRKLRNGKSWTRSMNSECSEDSADDSMDESALQPSADAIVLPKRRFPELKFSEDLKFHMGFSVNLIRRTDCLVTLPSKPNVVTILESYLKYFARTLCSENTLPKRGRKRDVFDKTKIEKRYNKCIEILDGLRICFNTYLFNKLLVNEKEQVQYCAAIKMALEPPRPIADLPPQNGDHPNHQNGVPNGEDYEDHVQGKQDYAPSIISQATSQTSQASQRTCSDCSLTKANCSKIIKETFYKVRDEHVAKADKWKAVPDSMYYEEIKQPAIVYGVYHLLRLLEVMPKILKYTRADDNTVSAVYSVCNGLLNYISTQQHLLGEMHMQKIIQNNSNETATKSDEPAKSRRTRRPQ